MSCALHHERKSRPGQVAGRSPAASSLFRALPSRTRCNTLRVRVNHGHESLCGSLGTSLGPPQFHWDAAGSCPWRTTPGAAQSTPNTSCDAVSRTQTTRPMLASSRSQQDSRSRLLPGFPGGLSSAGKLALMDCSRLRTRCPRSIREQRLRAMPDSAKVGRKHVSTEIALEIPPDSVAVVALVLRVRVLDQERGRLDAVVVAR